MRTIALLHALTNLSYEGRVAATAHSEQEIVELQQAGADLVFLPYADAAHEVADRLFIMARKAIDKDYYGRTNKGMAEDQTGHH